MIHVIATVELKPGCRAAYLKVLLSNVDAVKAEKGCLEYTPAIDVETDIPIHETYDDNVVTILESWKDITALKNHLKSLICLPIEKKQKTFSKRSAYGCFGACHISPAFRTACFGMDIKAVDDLVERERQLSRNRRSVAPGHATSASMTILASTLSCSRGLLTALS